MDDPEMVPKSDLVAVKESHAKAIEKLTADHGTAVETLKTDHGKLVGDLGSKAKTTEDELSRVRAAHAQLEEASRNHATTAEQLEGLKAELKTSKDALDEAQKGRTADLKDELTGVHRISDSALEGKTVAELTTIRDALRSTRSPDSRQYTGGGGSGGEPTKTGRVKITEGLESGELRRP